jgi:hypothetical protein
MDVIRTIWEFQNEHYQTLENVNYLLMFGGMILFILLGYQNRVKYQLASGRFIRSGLTPRSVRKLDRIGSFVADEFLPFSETHGYAEIIDSKIVVRDSLDRHLLLNALYHFYQEAFPDLIDGSRKYILELCEFIQEKDEKGALQDFTESAAINSLIKSELRGHNHENPLLRSWQDSQRVINKAGQDE